MRIINVIQGSEQWERWRNRPTASEFGSFITPARGEYSSQATSYAAKIVAKRLGVYEEPPPTWAMERGIELEPSAKLAYEKATGATLTPAGFIVPDETDAYGGSPDSLVDHDGLLEIKCPLAETLISYHAAGVLPIQYKPQVQALLLISGRSWCDFFAFHESLTPFVVRVEPDLKYQARIAECLLKLLEEIQQIETKVQRQSHQVLPVAGRADNVKWE